VGRTPSSAGDPLVGFSVALAAPLSRRVWRVLAIGTALLLAQLSLLLYAAYSIETNLQLVTSSVPAALWRSVEYLNVNVAPLCRPVLLAAWHTELRADFFVGRGARAGARACACGRSGQAAPRAIPRKVGISRFSLLS